MKAVLVTTKYRGVFFGYLSEMPNAPAELDLSGCRNCIYWSGEVGGFLGLAATGPTNKCRIGPTVDSITLYEVTSITPVSAEAEAKWKSTIVAIVITAELRRKALLCGACRVPENLDHESLRWVDEISAFAADVVEASRKASPDTVGTLPAFALGDGSGYGSGSGYGLEKIE